MKSGVTQKGPSGTESSPLAVAEAEPRLVIVSGPLAMEVIPQLAARVAQLSFQGRALLSGPENNPHNWGATYWTSPQADWGWPPVPEVDSAPFTASRKGEGWHLVGPRAAIDFRRFRIEKTFVPGPHLGTLDTYYTIVNEGESEFAMANWEISRMPAGGLTFYPTGAQELTPIAPHQAMPTLKEFGTTFFDHTLFEVGACQKLHADATGGYLAHVIEDLLLLKIFIDTRPEEQAPGEGECEIFANEDGKYVEIEVQGPHLPIEPGQSSTFKVRTVVCFLPDKKMRQERQALRAFADGQVALFARDWDG